MTRAHFWLPTTALLLLAGSGCVDDPKHASSMPGDGGAANGNAGTGGASSGAVAGNSSASAGVNSGEAGVGGVDGEAGEAAGGRGSVGGGAPMGAAGAAGAAGAEAGGPCSAGFADCNSNAGEDRCETDITTVDNCGACQHACGLSGVANSSCVSGHCAPTCAPHYADCNQSALLDQDDGCEIYLDALDKCKKDCGSASVACGPTEVCNDGSCVAPSGFATLSVPLTAADQNQRFADVFMPAANLEGATLTVRAYAPGATSGTLVIYVQDTASNLGAVSLRTDLTKINTKWADLQVPVASVVNGLNAANIKQVNVEVYAGVGSGPWTNPTVVYVDSIRTSNLAVNDTFDSSFGNFVKSSILVVAGSTITWTQSVP